MDGRRAWARPRILISGESSGRGRLGVLLAQWKDRRIFNGSLNEFNRLVERISKLFEARGRDDNGIAVAGNLLGDPQECPPGILLQNKGDLLLFDLKLGLEKVRVHGFLAPYQ